MPQPPLTLPPPMLMLTIPSTATAADANAKGNGARDQDLLETQPPAQLEAAPTAREDRGRRGCCRAESSLCSQRSDGHGRLALTIAARATFWLKYATK